MSVKLEVAAKRFLKWNIEGRKHARAMRGVWIDDDMDGNCVACKIGLVMIGRYGLEKARGSPPGYGYDRVLLANTLEYGPLVDCPVKVCDHAAFSAQYRDDCRYALGVVVEHLFEHHEWGVVKIDEWLSVLAGQVVFVDA